MKAVNSQLVDFIGANKQYCIPIFQRRYSWDRNDCIKLLTDVVLIAKDEKRPCHFIGSVIYLPLSQFASAITECHIIDGQQRLTTISLLLLALSDYAKGYYTTKEEYENSETRFEMISNMYLLNQYGKGDLKYKLKLYGKDFTVYKALISDDERKMPEGINSNRVHTNYMILLNELKKLKVNPELVLTGIRKLLLVDIPLEYNDNAQLVFETVNSTGKSLTEAEKIKNYILMTVLPEDQDSLYKDYWEPMESQLSSSEFNTFFIYYLVTKLKKQIPNAYYEVFKEFVRDDKRSTKDIIIEVKRYYDHYTRWKNASKQSEGAIDRIIASIKATGQNKITPVLLQILDDVKSRICSASEAEEVLKMIESYWMRRGLCNLPSNTAGTVCFALQKKVGSIEVVDGKVVDNYVNRFAKCITKELTYRQRVPKDDELNETLKTMPIYGKPFDRLLLDTIECYLNKDYCHNSAHSIEHIMPQTVVSHDELFARTDISEEKKRKLDWASDLGDNWKDIHEKYKDTLGNLSLTGYNPEYQNYIFSVKKEMKDGYNQSPIRLTSETVAKKNTWGEEEILERAEILSAIIAKIWAYPSIV